MVDAVSRLGPHRSGSNFVEERGITGDDAGIGLGRALK